MTSLFNGKNLFLPRCNNILNHWLLHNLEIENHTLQEMRQT